MMAFVHIFTTGQQTGESVMNGPIGGTMNFLCFDENTLIKNGSGQTVYMKNLKLGDSLPNNNKVTSIYAIDGADVPMYMLGTVKVSGGHKVWYKDAFIPVAEHPDAVRKPDSKRLVCINTHLRSFTIGADIFMDFTEIGSVTGVVGTTVVYGDVPISQIKVGDVLDGDFVCGTVMHSVEEMPVLYNLITYSSLCTPKVEKY